MISCSYPLQFSLKKSASDFGSLSSWIDERSNDSEGSFNDKGLSDGKESLDDGGRSNDGKGKGKGSVGDGGLTDGEE